MLNFHFFLSFSFEFLLWITVLEEINFSSFDSSRDLESHVCVLDFGCKLRVSRSFVLCQRNISRLMLIVLVLLTTNQMTVNLRDILSIMEIMR